MMVFLGCSAESLKNVEGRLVNVDCKDSSKSERVTHMGNKFTRREWIVGMTTGSVLSLRNPLQATTSSAFGTPDRGESPSSFETDDRAKSASASHDAETRELHASGNEPRYNAFEDFQLLMRTHPPKLDIPDDLSQIPFWQQTAASRFREILCLDASRAVPLDPRITWTSKRKGYRIEHIVIRTREFAEAPGLMLIPDGVSASHPAPAVLCLHGGVPGGKDEVAGETANPDVRRGLAQYHDNYAQQLAEQGFVTFAIDLVDFGERQYHSQSDLYGLNNPAKAHITIANTALMLGRTFFGLNLFDSIRALDYLESRPEVLRTRVGCAGFSFGANLAAWLGALDRRIKTIAIEGSWASWRRLAMRDLRTARYCTADRLSTSCRISAIRSPRDSSVI